MKSLFVNIHMHQKIKESNAIGVRNAYMPNPKKMTIKYPISVGLHPWFITQFSKKNLEERLTSLCQLPNCVAIGEVGLDKNYPHFTTQIEMFTWQVAVAKELKKPIIIHHVNALEDLFKVLKNFPEPIILHGYNGSIEQWKQLNFFNNTYISVGKNVFAPSIKLNNCIQSIPANRLFAETDQSRISIANIYEQLAIIRAEPMLLLKDNLQENFRRIIKY